MQHAGSAAGGGGGHDNKGYLLLGFILGSLHMESPILPVGSQGWTSRGGQFRLPNSAVLLIGIPEEERISFWKPPHMYCYIQVRPLLVPCFWSKCLADYDQGPIQIGEISGGCASEWLREPCMSLLLTGAELYLESRNILSV